jgi:serine/threonine protein kinase
MLVNGTRLWPYKIVVPLGRGGMGEVYRARDVRLGREVAVKVVPRELLQDPTRLARFEREAKVAAAIAHPNIPVLYDVGRQQDIPYAVTELLEGETLRARLAGPPLPWREALEIVAAVADGLTAAHAKGIVHRDIKPENLFLTTDGRVKILDLGLASVALPAAPNHLTEPYVSAHTETGAVLGALAYMSPEQLRGQSVDCRSDLFSLGCVLFELVTGKRPFAGRTFAETAAAILHQPPPPLGTSGLKFPPQVEQIVGRCLKILPEERFSSARDLAVALRSALAASDSGVTPPPCRAASRTRKESLRSLAVPPLAKRACSSQQSSHSLRPMSRPNGVPRAEGFFPLFRA